MVPATAALTAGWIPESYGHVLFAVLALASLGTLVLFAAGLVAATKRGSARYWLLAAALGGLVVRSAVGWGTALGVVPMFVHHVVEHGLGFVIAALVLLAVYRSAPSRRSGDDRGSRPESG